MAIRAGGFASRSAVMMTVLLVVAAPLRCVADAILYSGESLLEGQRLTRGKYFLYMYHNCNLAVFEGDDDLLWESNTEEEGVNCKATLKSNGNLVISDGDDKTVWESGSSSEEGRYVLVVQKDRNVVIYGSSRWETNTAQEPMKAAAISMDVVNN